jgi:hypothetical protein
MKRMFLGQSLLALSLLATLGACSSDRTVVRRETTVQAEAVPPPTTIERSYERQTVIEEED